MKGNRLFSKQKGILPRMKKTWFHYVTLPIFLFLLAYRIVECVLFTRRGQQDSSAAGTDTGSESKSIPLEKEPVEKTFFTPEAVPSEPSPDA